MFQFDYVMMGTFMYIPLVVLFRLCKTGKDLVYGQWKYRVLKQIENYLRGENKKINGTEMNTFQ